MKHDVIAMHQYVVAKDHSISNTLKLVVDRQVAKASKIVRVEAAGCTFFWTDLPVNIMRPSSALMSFNSAFGAACTSVSITVALRSRASAYMGIGLLFGKFCI